MTIVTRTSKGAALTWAEEDGNFTDLASRTQAAWQNLSGFIDTAGISNAPTTGVYNGIVSLMQLDPSIIQEVTVRYHIPKNYVSGTSIYPHAHIMSSTVSTGVVRLGFTYIWANEYDAHAASLGTPTADEMFGTPVTVYSEVTFAATHQNAAWVAEVSAPVTITGLAEDAIVLCRVFRDATHVNDTYPDPVFLLYADLYYQCQGFGNPNR